MQTQKHCPLVPMFDPETMPGGGGGGAGGGATVVTVADVVAVEVTVLVPIASILKLLNVLSPDVGGLIAKTIPILQCPVCWQ